MDYLGSVRLITLLNMCNGTEGNKTAVRGWWGALGNLATAPLEETPHTPGTTWQHKPIRVPASAPFFFTKVRRRKKLYSVSQMQDHRTEVRRKQNHFIVMVVLAAFIKYTQNCQSISKRSALVAKQFFSRCFFQWYGEPLINRTLPYVNTKKYLSTFC